MATLPQLECCVPGLSQKLHPSALRFKGIPRVASYWEFTRLGLVITLLTTLSAIGLLALEYRLFPKV
jgi:hypothetical protein